MKTLYLDTSSSFLYCGVVEDNVLLCEVKQSLEKELSTLTLQKIKTMLDKKEILPTDINKILVVIGPGSFTGVRIGITIAKTWAWALNIPISAISSLDAMAVSSDVNCDFYIPLIDARRGYVYTGIYNCNYNLTMKKQYVRFDTLRIAVEKLGDSYIYITNDNFPFLCEKYDPNILKIVNQFKDSEVINPHALDAEYLKQTEAEEKLNDN